MKNKTLNTIYRPKDDTHMDLSEFDMSKTKVEEIGYGAGGKHNTMEKTIVNIVVPTTIDDIDNPECIAKKCIIYTIQEPHSREVNLKPKTINTVYNFYIKMSTTGELYNPWGMYTEGQANRYAKHAGQPAWKYCKISEVCFEYYLKFLRTHNKAYLLNAEREVRNV